MSETVTRDRHEWYVRNPGKIDRAAQCRQCGRRSDSDPLPPGPCVWTPPSPPAAVGVLRNSFYIGQHIRFDSKTWGHGFGVVDAIYRSSSGALMYRVELDDVKDGNRYALPIESELAAETGVDRQIREAEKKDPKGMDEARKWVSGQMWKAKKQK